MSCDHTSCDLHVAILTENIDGSYFVCFVHSLDYERDRRQSNARRQPRREAGAERRLLGVGCTPLIMIEASPSAYHWGMLALGKRSLTNEEETSCDSTRNSTNFTVASICMPGPCMSVSSTNTVRSSCIAT